MQRLVLAAELATANVAEERPQLRCDEQQVNPARADQIGLHDQVGGGGVEKNLVAVAILAHDEKDFGVDRARIAAEQAVASPLLEGINLSGAKGVLVNITATRSLKMKEVNEVMSTVREFAAEDAHIIFGAVYDESMGDEIRVTVVATGLGHAQARRQPFEVINTPVVQATGTDGGFVQATSVQGIDYSHLDVPAVVRKQRNSQVEALASSGVDRYDIAAFLRKQAD